MNGATTSFNNTTVQRTKCLSDQNVLAKKMTEMSQRNKKNSTASDSERQPLNLFIESRKTWKYSVLVGFLTNSGIQPVQTRSQEALNIFVPGSHKLRRNSSRAGHLTFRDRLWICYFLPNQQIFRTKYIIFSLLPKCLYGWMK